MPDFNRYPLEGGREIPTWVFTSAPYVRISKPYRVLFPPHDLRYKVLQVHYHDVHSSHEFGSRWLGLETKWGGYRR